MKENSHEKGKETSKKNSTELILDIHRIRPFFFNEGRPAAGRETGRSESLPWLSRAQSSESLLRGFGRVHIKNIIIQYFQFYF